MAYSGGRLAQPDRVEEAGIGRDSRLAMEVIASVCPGRFLASVSGNNGGLDVAVAVQHVPQYIMQARERSFAGNVIRASHLLLGNQSESASHRLGSVMERRLQGNFRIMQPIGIQLHL